MLTIPVSNLNNATEQLVPRLRLDALSLEYQRDYGTACGDLDITDLLNNSATDALPAGVLTIGRSPIFRQVTLC